MVDMDLMYRSRYILNSAYKLAVTLKVIGLLEVIDELPPLRLHNIGLQKGPEAVDQNRQLIPENAQLPDHEPLFPPGASLQPSREPQPKSIEVDLGLPHGEEEFEDLFVFLQKLVGEDEFEGLPDLVTQGEVAPVVRGIVQVVPQHLPGDYVHRVGGVRRVLQETHVGPPDVQG